MKRVFRVTEPGKVKDIGLRGLGEAPEVESLDATVALIQALIPLGLQAVQDLLEGEVVRLAGARHQRTGPAARARALGPAARVDLPGRPETRDHPYPDPGSHPEPGSAAAGLPGAANPAAGRCRPLPQGAPRAELPGLRGRGGSGAPGVRTQPLDRLAALHPGQRRPTPGPPRAGLGRLRPRRAVARREDLRPGQHGDRARHHADRRESRARVCPDRHRERAGLRGLPARARGPGPARRSRASSSSSTAPRASGRPSPASSAPRPPSSAVSGTSGRTSSPTCRRGCRMPGGGSSRRPTSGPPTPRRRPGSAAAARNSAC